MKKELHVRISEKLKIKLITDSEKNGFPSMTAYLEKLIETGLPVSESLDLRLQLIEKKIDTLFHDIRPLKEDVNRRTFITFRLAAYILTRTFYIKPKAISDNDIKEANKIIEDEMNMFKKRSEIR